MVTFISYSKPVSFSIMVANARAQFMSNTRTSSDSASHLLDRFLSLFHNSFAPDQPNIASQPSNLLGRGRACTPIALIFINLNPTCYSFLSSRPPRPNPYRTWMQHMQQRQQQTHTPLTHSHTHTLRHTPHNCQQCLARSPVLALCLSPRHHTTSHPSFPLTPLLPSTSNQAVCMHVLTASSFLLISCICRPCPCWRVY